MTISQKLPIEYINTPEHLYNCVAYLQTQKVIAFDLEFDSHLYTYGFNLCLIQIASSENIYIIDPIIIKELSSVYHLFENENIEKIIHCCDSDIKLLHSLHCYPKNIFDTEIATKLLNIELSSLANLLLQFYGIVLDKKKQKSNWNTRPLSVEQINYAALDVAYLIPLKNKLHLHLKEQNKENWLAEECQTIENTINSITLKTYFLKPDDEKTLEPKQQFILNSLLNWREELGKKYNKPAFQVFSEITIRLIATTEFDFTNWCITKGIYHKLKTNEFANKIAEKIKQLENEWDLNTEKNIDFLEKNKDKKINKVFVPRVLMESIKANKFDPIYNKIVADYGQITATYIFSKNFILKLIQKTTTINAIKENYKKEIIINTSLSLEIDISEYFD